MGCCGGQRRRLRTRGPGPAAVDAARTGRRHGPSYFRYHGRTALSVRGPATGRLYRFARPGAVVAVDPRDQASLARLPQLGPVRGL